MVSRYEKRGNGINLQLTDWPRHMARMTNISSMMSSRGERREQPIFPLACLSNGRNTQKALTYSLTGQRSVNKGRLRRGKRGADLNSAMSARHLLRRAHRHVVPRSRHLNGEEREERGEKARYKFVYMREITSENSTQNDVDQPAMHFGCN